MSEMSSSEPVVPKASETGSWDVVLPGARAGMADASAAVRRAVRRTPMLFSPDLSEELGAPVHLKCENRQITGSFKVRGAFNAVRLLSEKERRRGVSTISAGNHAQAVAWAAAQAGVAALVVMPASASRYKAERARRLGAEVVLAGDVAEAFETVERITRERGLIFLHPFDAEPVVYGHATCGEEIFEELPEADAVVVPVGGGGLVSGVALAAKSKAEAGGARVWGVEPVGAAAMEASLRAREAVRIARPRSVADGLAPPMAGKLTFRIVDRACEGVALVTEDEILSAAGFLLNVERLVVEPSGAAGVAALRAGKIPVAGDRPVVAVLTGGNIDPRTLAELCTG